MKEMPPDQRAMVEKMMKEQGGGPPPAGDRTPLKFAKAGSAKVGAWPCDRYAAAGDGRKVEVCTAAAPALGISAEDVAVFEGFLDLSEKMAGEAGGGADHGFSGLPLERTESRDGKVSDRFTIETIKPETMAAADLQVPAGLKSIVPPGPPPAR